LHKGVGAFQDYYQASLLKEYSASTISWIPSLQIFFMMALGPFIGLIYDKYGPRWLIIGGTFLHVFGLMMTSISTEYYQILLSQGVCSAVGVSAIFQPGKPSSRLFREAALTHRNSSQ
jgi:MFS family permease